MFLWLNEFESNAVCMCVCVMPQEFMWYKGCWQIGQWAVCSGNASRTAETERSWSACCPVSRYDSSIVANFYISSKFHVFPVAFRLFSSIVTGPDLHFTVKFQSRHFLMLSVGHQGLYSQKVVNGGRWYDDRIMGVRSAIAIHETYRMYDCCKF